MQQQYKLVKSVQKPNVKRLDEELSEWSFTEKQITQNFIEAEKALIVAFSARSEYAYSDGVAKTSIYFWHRDDAQRYLAASDEVKVSTGWKTLVGSKKTERETYNINYSLYQIFEDKEDELLEVMYTKD
jgi:hypothetical protein